MPALMRSTMVACSNSANTAGIRGIIRPAAEPVSNGSVADRFGRRRTRVEAARDATSSCPS
jgi:hypothetical protein